MPEKSAKPARKRAARTKTKAKTTRDRTVDQSDIAERAYYIHLDQRSSNDVENWLRAERELTAA
ncbi:MAG TPA: hypothetical protein VGF70_14520 [Solirubrobacteraceae bacterium]